MKIRLCISYVGCCLFSIAVFAASEVSIGGGDFLATDSPITINQGGTSNAAEVVEWSRNTDSAVIQSGFYNRSAIIQLNPNGADNNLAIVRQAGSFSRALIVQVSDTGNNSTDIHQGGGPDSINNLFLFQISTSHPDQLSPVAHEFSILTPNGAEAVARNFTYGPELSRVNVGMLEDVSLHFNSVLEGQLDQDRAKSFYANQRASRPDCEAGASHGGLPPCLSTTPLFAVLSYGRADRESALGSLGYKQNIRSATIGANLFVSPKNRFGVAINLEKSDGSVRQGLGGTDTSGYQIGGFASVSHDQYYLDLIATVGKINFTADRFSGTTAASSDVDGWGYTGRMQAGYRFGLDNFHLGPLVAIHYSNESVGSYWEQGSLLTRQWIAGQDRERFVASIGALLDRQDHVAGLPLFSYLKIELERDFGIGGKDVMESRFAFSPDIIVFTPVDDVTQSTYGKISGGISFDVNRQIQISLAGMSLISADRLDRQSIYGKLSINF